MRCQDLMSRLTRLSNFSQSKAGFFTPLTTCLRIMRYCDRGSALAVQENTRCLACAAPFPLPREEALPGLVPAVVLAAAAVAARVRPTTRPTDALQLALVKIWQHKPREDAQNGPRRCCHCGIRGDRGGRGRRGIRRVGCHRCRRCRWQRRCFHGRVGLDPQRSQGARATERP